MGMCIVTPLVSELPDGFDSHPNLIHDKVVTSFESTTEQVKQKPHRPRPAGYIPLWGMRFANA